MIRSRAQTIAIILSRYKKKMGARSFASRTRDDALPPRTAQQTDAQRAAQIEAHARLKGNPGLANPQDVSILNAPIDIQMNMENMENESRRYAQEKAGTHRTPWPPNHKIHEKLIADKEAELRESPLIHFTSVEAAADMYQHGLKSAHEMSGAFKDVNDEITSMTSDIKNIETVLHLYDEDDRLRVQGNTLPEVAPAMQKARDGVQAKIDKIKSDNSWLPLDDILEARKEHRKLLGERIKLQDTKQGSTFDADTAQGLDEFVFAYHGVAGKDAHAYGPVAVILDNKVFYDTPGAFATPNDIIKYAQDDSGGNWTSDNSVYRADVIKKYRQQIVAGDQYTRAAAEGSVSDAFPQGKWELKVPKQIDKKHVIGFAVQSPEDYDALIEAGVPESKIKYIEEFGNHDALQKHAKHLQKTGGWFHGDDQYELPPE